MKGKALLIIERLNSAWVPFDVHAYIHSCSQVDHDLHEEFGLLTTDTLPLPDGAYKLKVGEKIWVKVVYEFTYSHDYYGECDVDLMYHKQKIIRRRKY